LWRLEVKTIAIAAPIVLFTISAFSGQSPATTDTPTGTRSFYMGFTGFVYDYTPAAVEATLVKKIVKARIKENELRKKGK
jgi:hypothetical protein